MIIHKKISYEDNITDLIKCLTKLEKLQLCIDCAEDVLHIVDNKVKKQAVINIETAKNWLKKKYTKKETLQKIMREVIYTDATGSILKNPWFANRANINIIWALINGSGGFEACVYAAIAAHHYQARNYFNYQTYEKWQEYKNHAISLKSKNIGFISNLDLEGLKKDHSLLPIFLDKLEEMNHNLIIDGRLNIQGYEINGETNLEIAEKILKHPLLYKQIMRLH